MRRKRTLSAQEQALWRAVARTARPLPGRNRDQTSTDEPRAASMQRDQERRKHGGENSGENSGAVGRPSPNTGPNQAPPRGPDDFGHMRKVRRGQVEIGATLDLHGMTQARAHAALRRFLGAARARGVRCALVVTGKGQASDQLARHWAEPGRGILRARLPDWLAAPDLREIVSGFSQAHIRHGGAGAFYVFLKKR